MYERFTDRSRRVVVLAQEEARLLNHNYLGTEHLLLGLIREGEAVAAKALDRMGVSLEDTRQKVGEVVGYGLHSPSGSLPFTPRTRVVCELSLRVALEMNHSYIGTEHLLLAIIREGEGVAVKVLVKKLGLDLNKVRTQVLQLLGERLEFPKESQPVQSDDPSEDQPLPATREELLEELQSLLQRAKTIVGLLEA